MAAETKEITYKLKLLIDKSSKKVLLAEAGKEVVDFLFGLMEMPMGSVIKLLSHGQVYGGIGNLHRSIDRLDDTYLLSAEAKPHLLDPAVYASGHCAFPLLPKNSSSTGQKRHYKCRDHSSYFSPLYGATCPSCKGKMTAEIVLVEAGSGDGGGATDGGCGGFVKGVVTYTIMDDLTVTPMSTISSITVLNKFNIKDVSAVEEKIVEIGLREGLELLKASLQSKTVLTDVFLLHWQI